MTPKPESETDPWAKVTPAMLAVLRTIENGEHEIVDCPVCQGVDALEALMAYVYTARAAEAAQHRQALVDARRAEHTVWKGRAEAADARLAAVEAERDKAVAEVCAFSREQGIEAAQEIAAKDETIRQQAAQIEALKEIADEAFGVCICGCQLSEHENYGEDGEQCENEMHECIRTSKAAYAVVHTLRARLAAVEAERDQAQRALATAYLKARRQASVCEPNEDQFAGAMAVVAAAFPNTRVEATAIRIAKPEEPTELVVAVKRRAERAEAERDRLKAALQDAVYTIAGWRTGSIGSIGNVHVGSFDVEHLARLRAVLTPQGQSTDGETR